MQNLEYIRQRVTTALANYLGSTKGQLEAFAEFAPADTASKKRCRIHFVDLEKRRVSADIDAVNCTETRSRKTPFPPIHEITYCSSSWRRALSALEDQQQAWLRYCYAHDLTFDLQVSLCKFIWGEFVQKLNGKKITEKMSKRLQSLIWLSIQDHVSQIGLIGHSYTAGELAHLVGVSKTNWSENYAGHWQLMHSLCHDLDHCALREIIVKRSDARSKILTS